MLEKLVVKVKKVMYYDPESAYSIFKGAIMKRDTKTKREKWNETATAKNFYGKVLHVHPNDVIEVEFAKEYKESEGYRHNVLLYKKIEPSSKEEVRKYLASFKGIGPKGAEKLVDALGMDVISKIADSESALENISIPDKVKANLREKILENRAFEEVLAFLVLNDIAPSLAIGLSLKYGVNAISILQKEPFLAYLDGTIDFHTANYLCYKQEVLWDNAERVCMAILATIDYHSTQIGDLFVPKTKLSECCTIFESVKKNPYSNHPDFNEEQIRESLAILKEKSLIVEDFDSVYLSANFHNECGIVKHLKEIMRCAKSTYFENAELNQFFASKTDIRLSEEQKEAVCGVLSNPASVITGGPGTGKTSTILTLINAIETLDPSAKIVLAAPTGKASKRMEIVTSKKAKTIHRLIKRVESKPDESIEVDILIVDEYSMSDAELTYRLLKNIPIETRIVFVGDYDQLPSVGAGMVLRDFIHSSVIPVFRLKNVFRQSGDGTIIPNAYKIINYKKEVSSNLSLGTTHISDFFFLPAVEPLKIQKMIKKTIKDILQLGEFRLSDIQVLSPMKDGDLGVNALNQFLQHEFNHSKENRTVQEKEFRVGDKVIHTVNNYDLEVFNGDTGVVKSIGITKENALLISYQEQDIWYPEEFLYELDLAYAMSVHKSQGSEFPIVIIPFHTSIEYGMNKNLVYTAVTRAKQKVALIGAQDSFFMSLEKEVASRNSNLISRLKD